MNTNELKDYAPEARRAFIEAVSAQAARLGITEKEIEPALVKGDILLVGGQAFPKTIAEPLNRLVARIRSQGFEATVEAIAYTWFNRFVAFRYMELHGYFDHGFRVLSHPAQQGNGPSRPEILDHAADIDLPGLDRVKVIELKLDGKQDEELYRLLLKAQCNALHQAMPFLFERINDETELLLPANLLHSDSLIRQLVERIEESAWNQIEVIGWLYQFYISEKKAQVIGKVVKSADIPAATQLFTPNWIVKYMVQNSLGAQWLATYPASPLAAQMEYYIRLAEQTDEVQAQLKAMTPNALNPEEMSLIDPACGSGHILVEAYELFKAIYLERGYRQRDVAKLILEKNLFGIDIDERAAQLTGFALMMKGRADDRQLFARGVKLNVMVLADSNGFEPVQLAQNLKLSEYGLEQRDLERLKELFEYSKTFGSLIRIPPSLAKKIPALCRLGSLDSQLIFAKDALGRLVPLARQAAVLAAQYDVVVMNPPYIGGKGMNALVKHFAKTHFADAKADLFACFVERAYSMAKATGRVATVTPYVWMFISSYEKFRAKLIDTVSLTSLVQLEYNGFEPACMPVATFSFIRQHLPKLRGSYVSLSEFKGHQNQAPRTLEAIRNPDCGWYYAVTSDDFKAIPGSPIAYSVPPRVREIFGRFPRLSDTGHACSGLQTGDNELYLRQWFEVSIASIELAYDKGQSKSRKRWLVHRKGGGFRRWFGNLDFVLDWKDDGKDVRSNASARPQNTDYWFKPAATWSHTSSALFSVRYAPGGSTFNVEGPSFFSDDAVLATALMCSAP